MELGTIHSYRDFHKALLAAGFSMQGDNNEGIFSLTSFMGPEIRWHTGDPETDPWQWRIRALTGPRDCAYGKFFFHKGSYITRQWFPFFLALRRRGKSLDELYYDGHITLLEKQVYHLVSNSGSMPLHEIKLELGGDKKKNNRIESALNKLQGGLFLTVCGEQQKRSKLGELYGWPSSTFCTAERYFGEAVWRESLDIPLQTAEEQVLEQVWELNPDADENKFRRFLFG